MYLWTFKNVLKAFMSVMFHLTHILHKRFHRRMFKNHWKTQNVLVVQKQKKARKKERKKEEKKENKEGKEENKRKH